MPRTAASSFPRLHLPGAAWLPARHLLGCTCTASCNHSKVEYLRSIPACSNNYENALEHAASLPHFDLPRFSMLLEVLRQTASRGSHDDLHEQSLVRVVAIVRHGANELHCKHPLMPLRSRLQSSMHSALQHTRKVADKCLGCRKKTLSRNDCSRCRCIIVPHEVTICLCQRHIDDRIHCIGIH